MAPIYDDFTAHHEYEFWIDKLLEILERDGLRGRRLLDIGCGTGKSFLPMLPRGWDVAGCDISPVMLAQARAKVGGAVPLSVADMRRLPDFGKFDLVWALDDAINYLLSIEELEQALAGMRRNLAPSGLLLFDVNELLVFRSFFAETVVVEQEDRRLVWRGMASRDVAPSSICESRLEVEGSDSSGALDEYEVSVHRQRHFSESEVRQALDRAGLQCLNVYGHSTDGIPRQPMDASTHTKAIYIACRDD